MSLRLALGIVLPLSAMLWGAGCVPRYTPKVGVESRSGSSSTIRPAGPSQSWYTGSHPPEQNSAAAVTGIQAMRQARGLNSLVWHDGLASVANMHSIDMRNRAYLSIVTPDGYDVFQSLVAANPRISFDNAFVAVYQVTPANTPILGVIQADPVASAAISDSAFTNLALLSESDRTFTWYTLILARNARP